MPFYEYQCESCGHRLEALQKMSDDPLVFCPECNESTLKKLISAAAFRLKGTGWYETDFKHNSGKKEEKKAGAGDTGVDNPGAGNKGSGDSGDSGKATESASTSSKSDTGTSSVSPTA
ncbi:MAG: zinc ribbon domain-containing protein [Gammaproteobacteria bacterium]|nr:zinc ribbon domain-containing protein [Gammaproteobacteria bacterium]